MKVLIRFLTILATVLVCFACPQPQPSECLPPRNVNVTNITDSSAVVSWSPVAGVSTYELRLFKLVDTVYQEVSNELVADTTKTLTNLTPNTDYKVEVRSKCPDGKFSKPASTTFRTPRTVIIDDIVFIGDEPTPITKPQAQTQGNRCVGQGKVPMSSSTTINNNTTFPISRSFHLTQSQALCITINKNNNPLIVLCKFSIIREYTSTPWSVAHDNCDKYAPHANQNSYPLGGTNEGVDLNFKLSNKTFNVRLYLNDIGRPTNPRNVTITIPSGYSAVVKQYTAP